MRVPETQASRSRDRKTGRDEASPPRPALIHRRPPSAVVEPGEPFARASGKMKPVEMTSARGAKRRLKEEATLDERTLMVALDAAREPHSFQYVVMTVEADRGYYIVDFYLPRRHLLVELDGAPHASESARWRDRLRTEAIERARPRDLLVRFWN